MAMLAPVRTRVDGQFRAACSHLDHKTTAMLGNAPQKPWRARALGGGHCRGVRGTEGSETLAAGSAGPHGVWIAEVFEAPKVLRHETTTAAATIAPIAEVFEAPKVLRLFSASGWGTAPTIAEVFEAPKVLRLCAP